MYLCFYFTTNKGSPWTYFLVPPLLSLQIRYQHFHYKQLIFRGTQLNIPAGRTLPSLSPRELALGCFNKLWVASSPFSHAAAALCTAGAKPQHLPSSEHCVASELQMKEMLLKEIFSLKEICLFAPPH